MTQLSNTFEGGSNGVTISFANSGGASGDAFDTVTRDTGGATPGVAEFTNVLSRDLMAGRFASRTVASVAIAQYTLTRAGTLTTEYGRAYFATDESSPAQNVRVVALTNSASAIKAAIQLTTGRVVRMETVGGSTVDFSTVGALPINTWYRFEWYYDVATTTFTVRAYLGDSATLLETHTLTNLVSPTDLARRDFGQGLGLANLPSATGFYYFDNVVVGATGWPGGAGTVPLKAGAGIIGP